MVSLLVILKACIVIRVFTYEGDPGLFLFSLSPSRFWHSFPNLLYVS